MLRPLLLLLLLLTSGGLAAEPLYPMLSPHKADSLRRQLWRTPSSSKRIALLLALSQDLIIKYQYFATPLDSALFYRQQAESLSRTLMDVPGQIMSSYVLGNLWLGLDKAAEGRRLLMQGLAASRQNQYARLEADGLHYLNETYTVSAAEFPRRIAGLRRAMKLYQSLNDGERAAYTLKTIADLYQQQGQYGQARDELLRALDLYRAIGYRKLHYTFDLLGAVYTKLGDYQEALRYGKASIESALATRDTADLNLFYCRMGARYVVLHQHADALVYYNSVLLRAEKARNAGEVTRVMTMITPLLIEQHRSELALRLVQEKLRRYPPRDRFRIDSLNLLTICYLANKQYVPAEACVLQLIQAIKRNQLMAGRNNMLALNYGRAGALYLATRQYAKARLYINKGWELQAYTSPELKSRALLQLFKLDSAQGNYLTAIAYQQRYQVLRDSIFNEKRSKQLAGLQVLNNLQKKEHDMAALTKQNLVQQVNLRQREGQRNALLLGVVMLALLMGLGYNRYRLKQRSNRLLESQRQEISFQNQLLEKILTEKSSLLEEKEWMLKEIHHRVKNNLQIIGSLLRSQAVYLQDGTARTAMRESRNRVHSMALIHQKLYQSNRLAGVPMDAYIQEIVEHLLASFDCQGLVQTELAVAAVELDVALAVPVGLILNEAITNTLKYAFPEGRKGRLAIGLEVPAEGHYCLSICDNGVGLPVNFEPQQSRTLGLELIRGLSKQIGGRLRVESDHGLQIRLAFDHLVLTPRNSSIPSA